MKNNRSLNAVKAVLFDAYGTLVEIRDKRAPFRQLLRIGEQQGRLVRPQDAATLMSSPLGLRDAAQLLGIRLAKDELARLESDLQAEIASIRLFDDAAPALRTLQERGFRIGLCSNLAAEYAGPVTALLPVGLDACIWSFEAGAIKPNQAIYRQACQALGFAPANILMVGDTLAADVDGPRQYGMQSILLDRLQSSPAQGTLGSLSGVADMLVS